MNKIIEKRNAKFNSMTDKQKRVAIAKDVLASIKVRKFKIQQGTYCALSFDNKINTDEELNLQELMINNKIQSCKVCAIGSIFMSRVSLGNDYNINPNAHYEGETNIDDDEMLYSLVGIFSERQLRLMEYIFEGYDITGYFNGEDEYDQFHDMLKSFSKKYRTPTAKLKAIMENVISNDGEFIITKEIKVEIK
jgi:hypothetical protein